MDHGDGCRMYDVDGNEFIDFMCALGPITIGYNDPTVNDAVIKQVNKFASASLQSELEVELAEKICEIIPCAEMVRFVKNGGDATTAAVRLARAFTGRDIVLMSGYHGMHDRSVHLQIIKACQWLFATLQRTLFITILRTLKRNYRNLKLLQLFLNLFRAMDLRKVTLKE